MGEPGKRPIDGAVDRYVELHALALSGGGAGTATTPSVRRSADLTGWHADPCALSVQPGTAPGAHRFSVSRPRHGLLVPKSRCGLGATSGAAKVSRGRPAASLRWLWQYEWQ